MRLKGNMKKLTVLLLAMAMLVVNAFSTWAADTKATSDVNFELDAPAEAGASLTQKVALVTKGEEQDVLQYVSITDANYEVTGLEEVVEPGSTSFATINSPTTFTVNEDDVIVKIKITVGKKAVEAEPAEVQFVTKNAKFENGQNVLQKRDLVIGQTYDLPVVTADEGYEVDSWYVSEGMATIDEENGTYRLDDDFATITVATKKVEEPVPETAEFTFKFVYDDTKEEAAPAVTKELPLGEQEFDLTTILPETLELDERWMTNPAVIIVAEGGSYTVYVLDKEEPAPETAEFTFKFVYDDTKEEAAPAVAKELPLGEQEFDLTTILPETLELDERWMTNPAVIIVTEGGSYTVYVLDKEEPTARLVNTYFSIIQPEEGYFTEYAPSTTVQFVGVEEDSTQELEVPAVTAEDGYVFTGWKVEGEDITYWDAAKESFTAAELNPHFPEGDNTGYVSISAQFVEEEARLVNTHFNIVQPEKGYFTEYAHN